MHCGTSAVRVRQLVLALSAFVFAASMLAQVTKPSPIAGSVGFNLGGLILPDTWPTAATSPALAIEPSSPDIVTMDAFVVHLPPPQEDVARPTENPVDRFFRTGVLKAIEYRRSTLKMTVGPCEGGQLLNLKSNW